MEDTPEDSPFGEQSIPVRQIVEKPERESAVDAKSGPPGLDEWQDFFGRFVIKLLVESYIHLVLGELADDLSPQEAQAIMLSKEDMREIAAPLAEMSNKSSYMRKHGRSIIAISESYESVVTLLLWMNRVNRIARKHRKANPKPRRARGQVINSQEVPNAQRDGQDSAKVNGTPVNGYGPVFNPGSG